MQIQTDRALIPANADATRYLTVTVSAPRRERRAGRPATAVSLVLDRSGSMGGTKITMARKAVELAIRLLDDQDQLAVVVYDTEVDVVLDRIAATAEAKALAMKRLAAVDARGGTDLAGGWMKGADFAPERVLLLTDGLANHGLTDPDVLAAKAAEFKARGIATSTFGVGADFDETLLARLAVEGGGHFYYIENPRQIPDLLASELGEMLEVVAHDVCLEIRCGDGMRVSALNDFPVQGADAGLRIRLGDLVAGQDVTIVVAVACAAQPAGAPAFIDCRVTDRAAVLFSGAMRVDWTRAAASDVDAQPIDASVCVAAAELLAARAKAEALELNRAGQFEAGAALLKGVAGTIRVLAPAVAEVQAIADALEHETADYLQPMAPVLLKQAHFANYSALRGRSKEGKAKRKAER